MDEKDLPSSDESDADFVPKEEDYNSGSGSELTDCDSSETENKIKKGVKRKKKGKKSMKKIKITDKEPNSKEENDELEEKNIDVDALWADFKKDVNKSEEKKVIKKLNGENEEKSEPLNKTKDSTAESNEKNTIPSKTKIIPNLSHKPKVGGLSKVLTQIGKKDKMSTLQKSQLDWNNFKKSEGIEEEIKLHNKGKGGYLDKQDFLQRTDLRQFEIEKNLRNATRKF